MATMLFFAPLLLRRRRVIEGFGDIGELYDELDAAKKRIEKLEAALREIAYMEPEDKYWPGRIARKALDDAP
ncbi:hypothetical protein UFOVP120_41 [uncultured Caudovirales phage]|uniref:Uncharacterized protein n=1 Tax=uncultured Caudovirales phage TaxID=2100421 RepID=A0A6J5LC04_9CAUD|nr:hypothetical protein UFOVP120_41 [uncultured Caudovirales phage]